jgi:hypothetical protein
MPYEYREIGNNLLKNKYKYKNIFLAACGLSFGYKLGQNCWAVAKNCWAVAQKTARLYKQASSPNPTAIPFSAATTAAPCSWAAPPPPSLSWQSLSPSSPPLPPDLMLRLPDPSSPKPPKPDPEPPPPFSLRVFVATTVTLRWISR